MPHSSGGGSHSGGSHGGSHHSGSHGGSSGTNRRHSPTYFDGARHYVYYKNKKPVHYYSEIKITNEYIRRRKRLWKLVKWGLTAIYSLIFVIIFLTAIFVRPHKLVPECVDSNRIIDTREMIDPADEQKMMAQLDEFRELTGISVTILTVNDEVWDTNFYTLENYAYDYYVTNLKDEKNWLLVYSEPETYTEFNDWKWEGMQGDDTDSILTSASTDKFNKEMHKNISKDGFGLAVTETFDTFNDIVMKPYLNILVLVIVALGLAFHSGIFFLVSWIFLGSQIKVDEQSIELANPQFSYIEDTCQYCDGLYIHGIHTSCPHCGATLAPLDRPIIMQ